MTKLFFGEALLPGGWARNVRVEIADGVIASVVADAAPEGERHAIALPGLGNVHSHAFQRGMAGRTEVAGPASRDNGADTFWTWREGMYRFGLKLTPDDMEAIAALAFAEMLEGGFTHVEEFHYLHHAPDGARYDNVAEMSARIFAAGGAAGIGVTLVPVFYAHGGFGPQPPSARQARFLNDLESYARLVDAARAYGATGVAAHSLRAATLEDVRAVAAMGAPMHIHVAEQTKEVDDCIAALGARPVALLLDNAPVDRSWRLVHATHMDAQETARLAQTGAAAALCPITEANLGDGLFPAKPYLDAGGRIAIGSDSNVRIDAAEELRTLEYGQRLATRTRNVLAMPGGSTGRRLFDLALEGGETGGIAIGASADIVSLDVAAEGDAILDAWIFARAPIDCVWRGGRKLVEAGRHVAKGPIAARARAAMERLRAG
ncbi:MAG: formimidoylglutamate deiminase [Hyphomonadaceae bacterium]|nr:formimidoylglutamate deiminase [Hyphomonadaceae bacterium]